MSAGEREADVADGASAGGAVGKRGAVVARDVLLPLCGLEWALDGVKDEAWPREEAGFLSRCGDDVDAMENVERATLVARCSALIVDASNPDASLCIIQQKIMRSDR